MISFSFIGEVFLAYVYTLNSFVEPNSIQYTFMINLVDYPTNISVLGQIIYTLYSPLFIIASIILLVSMIDLLC